MDATSPEIIDELHLKCPFCNELHKVQLSVCPTHNMALGFPNVNIVNTPNQNEALEKRYTEAIEYAKQNNYSSIIEDFEKTIEANAVLTINVKYEFLYPWLTEDTFAYKSYYKLLREQKRSPMDFVDEGRRAATDSRLYGCLTAEELCFAALTLDGVGVLSYGHYSVCLKTDSIRKRTSLIEENSWKFAEAHELSVSAPPPLGYRTIWDKRKKLAVAKCFKKLQSAKDSNDFASAVLKQGSDRMNDDYIEGHVFGNIVSASIFYVKGCQDQLIKDCKEYISQDTDRRARYAEFTWERISSNEKWIAV